LEVTRRTISLLVLLVVGLPRNSAAQLDDVPADTVIHLERTSCFGPCPIYAVTIDAQGTITYNGIKFVRVVGRQIAHIAPSLVARLLATAARVHFFDLHDAYRVIENPDGTVMTVTDQPTTIVTITVNGRTKRVEDYVGAPDSLMSFEREVDDVARTIRWIFLDEATLEELRTAGWSASGDEGATLLQQAIGRDDLAIARTLIEMGGRLDGPPTNRLPALVFAHSAAMVDLLVHAGADPNERPIGKVAAMTPLMGTAYKDAGVAEALIKAGARVDDVDNERNALWYAACRGNWRVVTVLLRAGASVHGPAEMSALECTRRVRQGALARQRTVFDSGQPTVDDYDRVIALLEQAEKPIKR
jgi:hypothetical protein